MKFVGVREAQAQLSELLDQAQRERVVLTRHGRPVAVLTGVEGRDIETVFLLHDSAFRDLIARRKQYKGPLVSHEALKAEASHQRTRATTNRKRRVRTKKKP